MDTVGKNTVCFPIVVCLVWILIHCRVLFQTDIRLWSAILLLLYFVSELSLQSPCLEPCSVD